MSQINLTNVSLKEVIEAVGSNDSTIPIGEPIDIGPSPLVVPANVSLRFARGGKLRLQSNARVIINGSIEPGPYQIFSGPGSVEFGDGATDAVRPEWFHDGTGDWAEAINRALDALGPKGGTVKLSRREYPIKDTIYFNGHSRQLVGVGKLATTLSFDNPAGGTMVAAHKGQHTSPGYDYTNYNALMGLQLLSANATIAVDFSGFSRSVFSDLVVLLRNPEGVGFYGRSNAGHAPYYNVFEKLVIAVPGSTESRAFLFDAGAIGSGPNGNIISNIQRIAPCGIGFDLRAGNGNLISNVNLESVYEAGFAFNRFPKEIITGEVTGGHRAPDSADQKASLHKSPETPAWRVNEHVGKWVLVKSAGAGGLEQARLIVENDEHSLTVFKVRTDPETGKVIDRLREADWTVAPQPGDRFEIAWVLQGRPVTAGPIADGAHYLEDTRTDYGKINHTNGGLEIHHASGASQVRRLGTTEGISFKITDVTVENLRLAQVPAEVLTKLEPLKNQVVQGRTDFVNLLQATLPEPVGEFQALIERHSVVGYRLVALTQWSGVNVPQSGDTYDLWPGISAGNKISGVRIEGWHVQNPDLVQLYPGATRNRIEGVHSSSRGAGKWVAGSTGDPTNQVIAGQTVHLNFTLENVPAEFKGQMAPKTQYVKNGLPLGSEAVIKGVWLHASAYHGGTATATIRAAGYQDLAVQINDVCRRTAFRALEVVNPIIGARHGLAVELATDSAWQATTATVTVVVEAVLIDS